VSENLKEEEEAKEKQNMKGKKEFQYQIEEDIDNLPDVTNWPNRPIYYQSGRNTTTTAQCNNNSLSGGAAAQDSDGISSSSSSSSSLPLGKPIDFETDLFKGKILLRVRNIDPKTVPKSHTEYFEGRKRLMNHVVQGQFKQSGLKMSDVWIGDVYEKPYVMPNFVARFVIPFFQRLSPGLIMDFTASSSKNDNNKVIILMAGGSQTLSVNQPGSEPDITCRDLCEDTALLLGGGESNSTTTAKPQLRRKLFRKKKIASKYEYDPNLVYTFNFYDDVIDFESCSVHMGKLGTHSLEKSMNGNPFSLTAQTTDGREIFRFNIFHELLVKYKQEEDETKEV